MNRALAFPIALTVMLLSICTHAQTKFNEEGLGKLESKEYAAAIEAFSLQLKQQPKDSVALSGIVRAYMFSDNYKEAQRYIEEGIRYYPSSSEFFYRRGLLNTLRGQFRKAITDFDKAYTLSSGSMRSQILINRGIAHMRDESPDKALSDFNEALTINPRNVNAYNHRGFLHHRQGNFPEAISDFSKAIDLDAENVLSYYNRGMAYLRSGDKAKACPDFHKACSKGNVNACKMIVGECSGGRME